MKRCRLSCMRFCGGTQPRGDAQVMTGAKQRGCEVVSVPHHFVILHQDHVVGTESCDEDDAGHTLKAVDPLLPL